MVLTLMSKEEREAGIAATRCLGGFLFRPDVGASTTHVIVGEAKRSIAVLKEAIAESQKRLKPFVVASQRYLARRSNP